MDKKYLHGLIKALVVTASLYFTTLFLTYLFLFIGKRFFLGSTFYSYETVEIIRSLVLLSIIYFFLKNQKKEKFCIIKKNASWKIIIIVLVAPILFRISIDPFIWINENLESYEIPSDNYAESTNLIKNTLTFMSTVFLAPIIEEILFRGVIIKYLKYFKPNFKIVISSLLFTLVHLPLDINSLIMIFLLGIALGYVCLRLGLLYSIIFHCVYNLVWFIMNLYPSSYWELIYGLNFNYKYWGIIVLAILSLILIFRKIEILKKEINRGLL